MATTVQQYAHADGAATFGEPVPVAQSAATAATESDFQARGREVGRAYGELIR